MGRAKSRGGHLPRSSLVFVSDNKNTVVITKSIHVGAIVVVSNLCQHSEVREPHKPRRGTNSYVHPDALATLLLRL